MPPPDDEEEEGEQLGGHEGAAMRATAKDAAAAAGVAADAEWGEFLHLPGQKFFDFNDIRDEITRETDRVCSGKSISHQPLNLAIYSPHVLTLTLVDLPGITKVAIAGQPEDIEQQINAMILSFISSPHSIIVAVSAANTDIANSDSLKLAREVDPTGIRTLGVLTKIDLMDRGTDAMQVLNNNSGVELQHGFVGVVCRSQEAITQRRMIRDALQAEKLFFANHPIYRSIASRLGTPFLARKLNSILMLHIQSSLPEIRNRIQATIGETQSELESYGSKGLLEDVDRGGILLPLISKYCSHLNDALDGRSPDVSTTELYGGARISFVFTDVFGQVLESINPLDLLSDHDIRISIRNASGPRPALFIPEVCFELLVKKQIERLLVPSLDCVDLVFHELGRVALQCELLSSELIRFPQLRIRLLQVFQQLLKSCLEPTKAHIEALIQCELSFINTSHPDFIGGSQAVAIIMERIQKLQSSSLPSSSSSSSSSSVTGSNVSTDSHPSDLSSKVAGVTGNVTVSGKMTNGTADAPPPGGHNSKHYYGNSRVSSTPSATSAPATSGGGGRGFLSSFLWRTPAPQTPPRQPGARYSGFDSDRKRTSLAGAPDHTNSTLESMHEHDMYAAPASSGTGAAAAVNSIGGIGPVSGGGVSSYQLRTMEPTERELIETEVIKTLMQSYFNMSQNKHTHKHTRNDTHSIAYLCPLSVFLTSFS